MKIVTVNVPESYIEAIEKLVGENGLYPSRSELIRCAVREFLLKELKMANNMAKYKEESKDDDFDKNKFVRVPVEKLNEKREPVREFKTYKIVKRFDDIMGRAETKIETAPIRKYQKKGERSLGNPFWEEKIDENGNLIQVPKSIN